MPIVPTGDLVRDAYEAGRGVGALNVILLEHVEAVVTGAERAGSPVVVQISENCVRYHGSLAPLAQACLAAAASASVPVALHLDHATSVDLVREAVALGFGSVMYDGSTLDDEHNTAQTRDVAAECHASGVWVEAELGEIGGKDGAHAPGVRTDPDDAADFVEATAVDALAVAVGSSHAMTTRAARLDLDLIDRLHRRLQVPLVLHGSSGVDDAHLAEAVAAGMTKINVATRFNQVFTRAVRDQLGGDADVVDPRKYVGAGRTAMAEEVATLLRAITT